MVVYTARSSHDKVGLVIFTEEVEKFISPGRGNRHVMNLIREVLTFLPAKNGTSLSSALDFTNTILKKRSILFLISDFHDHSFENQLAQTAEKHDLVCIQLLDPREEEAPVRGLYRFMDPENGESVLFDGRSRKGRSEWERLYLERHKKLKSCIRNKGADLLTLHAG